MNSLSREPISRQVNTSRITPQPTWAEWRASPHRSSRKGKPVTAIIYHFTAGPSLDGTVRWFRKPNSKVSAHYVIGKDGRLVQMVPLSRAAWHAGKSSLGGRRGVNRFSVGIEIVNWGALRKRGRSFVTHTGRPYTGPTPIRARGRYWAPFTIPQYKTIIRLTRYLLSRFPTITHITGHEDVALPPGRKNDPGGAFDWNRIRAGLPAGSPIRIGPLTNVGLGRPAVRPRRTLRRGSRGEDVRLLQRRLNQWIRRRGVRLPGLAVDGRFGARTAQMVRAFQRIQGLVSDGIVGSRTWAKLNALGYGWRRR